MKTQWLVTTILALAAGVAFARDASKDEGFILRAEAAICSAYESSDADVLRDDLDEHFTLTDSRGVVTSRDQEIAAVAKRDPVYLVFRNHDQKVRVYGDAAVVTGVTTTQGHSGGSTFEGDFAYTDTWIHLDGRWKLAASHASRLPAK